MARVKVGGGKAFSAFTAPLKLLALQKIGGPWPICPPVAWALLDHCHVLHTGHTAFSDSVFCMENINSSMAQIIAYHI